MKAETKEMRRKALDPLRKGRRTVAIPFPLGSPMPVKNCTVCGKACPYTTAYQFACKPCNLLFD